MASLQLFENQKSDPFLIFFVFFVDGSPDDDESLSELSLSEELFELELILESEESDEELSDEESSDELDDEEIPLDDDELLNSSLEVASDL